MGCRDKKKGDGSLCAPETM